MSHLDNVKGMLNNIQETLRNIAILENNAQVSVAAFNGFVVDDDFALDEAATQCLIKHYEKELIQNYAFAISLMKNHMELIKSCREDSKNG